MTSPQRPSSTRAVDYKGEPLDAGRGPGLGCFRFQMGLLAILLLLTPLSVVWEWPFAVSAILLFLVLILLLFAGQTVIFLLRLVAADRREGTRHRPLASATPTVGELEDAAAPAREPAGPAGTTDRASAPEAAVARPETAAPGGAPPDTTPPDTTALTDPRTTDPGMRE